MSREQVVCELHKQARRRFKRRRVITKGIDDLWQADLVEMGNYATFNDGFRFLLTIIDTFSKYAWAVALKSKNANEVTRAMKSVIDAGRKPKYLQTDDGKEFFNKEFQGLMKKHDINHYSTFSVLKASIVERFNRTLKNFMWKEFSLHGSYKWIDNYKALVDFYNGKVHRTIGMPPNKVTHRNENLILNRSFRHLKIYSKPKFSVGDNVRISKYKHIFEKGYTPNWTTEIFKIDKVQNTNPSTYILKDYQGKIIKGAFYTEELQKSRFPDLYLVEKVLKTRGNKVYVKWLGFPNDHNSWIDKNDIF